MLNSAVHNSHMKLRKRLSRRKKPQKRTVQCFPKRQIMHFTNPVTLKEITTILSLGYGDMLLNHISRMSNHALGVFSQSSRKQCLGSGISGRKVHVGYYSSSEVASFTV